MTLKTALMKAVENWWNNAHRYMEPDDGLPEWVDTICNELGQDFDLARGHWLKRRGV